VAVPLQYNLKPVIDTDLAERPEDPHKWSESGISLLSIAGFASWVAYTLQGN
jgi:hypothetical protein